MAMTDINSLKNSLPAQYQSIKYITVEIVNLKIYNK